MDANERRHEDLVDKVEKELMNLGYQEVYKHTTYSSHNKCGEIDVFVRNQDNYLVFEIKGTDSIRHYKKAKKQLVRAERYCFTDERCFLFYVYGNKYGKPVYRRMKNETNKENIKNTSD
jgi:hypothetical protein